MKKLTYTLMPREVTVLEIITDKQVHQYYIKDMNGNYALWFEVNYKDKKRLPVWSETYHTLKSIIKKELIKMELIIYTNGDYVITENGKEHYNDPDFSHSINDSSVIAIIQSLEKTIADKKL